MPEQLMDVWRGSVTTAECDEIGHMNVRYYVERSLDGLTGLGLALGFGPRRLDALQMGFVVREHHVRFLSELRAGTPCVLRSGVLHVADERMRVYQELVRATDERVCATFQLDVEYAKENGWRPETLPGELRARASNQLVSLPDYAAPRGIRIESARALPTLTEADDLGLIESYRGVVSREQTDLMCRMRLPCVMGIFSTAAPSFFLSAGNIALEPDRGLGAVALEYRIVYRITAILADVIVVRSGLKAVSDKTLHFCHWMFHAETGECLHTAEAVAVLFDMHARKAVSLSEETRARLGERALSSLTP